VLEKEKVSFLPTIEETLPQILWVDIKAALRTIPGVCKRQLTGDWVCPFFSPPTLTDYCVQRGAAAHFCEACLQAQRSLFGVLPVGALLISESASPQQPYWKGKEEKNLFSVAA